MANWLIKNDLQSVMKAFIAVILVLVPLRFGEAFIGMSFNENALLGLGFLLLSGIAMGRLARLLGLPSLTGYLIAGVLSGPWVLAVVKTEQVGELKLINSLALALIALQAGSEFTLSMLQKSFKSLMHSCWIQTLLLVGGVALAFVAYVTLFSPDLPNAELAIIVPVALVFGVIALSKSPAVVIAELSESGIKNRLGDHAIGMVVVLDVIVLILFAVALSWARAAVDPFIEFSFAQLSALMSEIAASIAAGTSFGLVMVVYLRWVDRQRLLFILAISYGLTALCEYLHYETLLVFVTAGFVVTNFSKQTEKLLETIHQLSSVVMIIFFATMGVSLKVGQIADVWVFVTGLFVIRGALTWVSEWLSAKVAESGPILGQFGWTPFISQAGLSIGLAAIVQDRLPEWGPFVATVAVALITLNEVFGPLFFKWGLQKAERAEALVLEKK